MAMVRRVIIRMNLFAEFEILSEENFKARQESAKGILHIPTGMVQTHADCEHLLRSLHLLNVDTEVVRL